MDEPLVSIIMRSYNEGWALHETLPALRAQDYRNWELIIIDSGSTDGSAEMIRAVQPRHFVQIQPHEYNPSRVMNHGMQLARSAFGIFLNADATPQGTNWLRPLATALFDPQAAAVLGRQTDRFQFLPYGGARLAQRFPARLGVLFAHATLARVAARGAHPLAAAPRQTRRV